MFQNLVPVDIIKEFGDSNSQVELVKDKTTEKPYIRKRIKDLDSPLQLAMFRKETNALNKLQACENIVRLIDAQALRGKKSKKVEGIVILEYIQGETLDLLIQKSLSICEKYNIVKQMFAAFEAAHSLGIIHRDINPSNIMIDNGTVKVIDFGICKIRGENTSATTFQYATNRYSAPEVIYHSENSTEKSDMYSLGATIFFLFTKKEPPIPDSMHKAIDSVAGIDPIFKTILAKMTALQPADRYEDLSETNQEMMVLYEKYIKSDEIYPVIISSRLLEKLKRYNLLQQDKTIHEILQVELPRNFREAYAYITYDDKKNHSLIFDGRFFSLLCIFDENSQRFIVSDVRYLLDYRRISNKQEYMAVSGNLFFSANNSSPLMRNDAYRLFNRIIDHQKNVVSTQNIDRVFRNKYGFWYDYIDIKMDKIREDALRFTYDKYDDNHDMLIFHLADETVFNNDQLGPGDSMIIEKNGENKIETVGEFHSYNATTKSMYIKAIRRVFRRLPDSGVVVKDYRSDINQYQYQRDALDDFVREETSNSINLKGVFSGLISPEIFDNFQVSKFFEDSLDEAQKAAVEKALAAKDIFVIQGPPGTGKTKVIVEIVRQMIKTYKSVGIYYRRILIVSQAHAAVDKLLDDLDEHLYGIPTIRVGDEVNLSQLAQTKYSLPMLKQNWINSSITRALRKLNRELFNLSIEVEDFNLYIKAVEIQENASSTSAEKDEASLVINSFNEKYSIDFDSPEIIRLRILNTWIQQIGEKENIVEYFIKNAHIIIGTCSGFLGSRLSFHLKNICFDCVVIDEAAKATVPELMLSIVKSKKVIMVGDHMQLPPVFDESALSDGKRRVEIQQLKEGGFKQLYETLPDESRQFLTTQYRMHPCIGSMIGEVFYPEPIQNGIDEHDRYLDIPSFDRDAIVWISTSNWPAEKKEEQPCIVDNRNTFKNEFEASIIDRVLQSLDEEIGDKGYSIGIITPYRGQLEILSRDLPTLGLKNIKVDINTVDAFQGSQRDIILYSTVRSSANSKIGFLREKPRLNVAFSRAKSLLLIVGDLTCLYNAKDAEFFKVIDYMRNHDDCCKIIDYRRDEK